jgi:hypothetical protein
LKTFTQNDPLTDAELDLLGDFPKGGRAMNVEQLDGFFAALIAGPEDRNAQRVQLGCFRR